MKLTLRQQITQFAQVLQNELFPVLQEELGELTAPAKRLVATLEMIPLARFVPSSRGWIGRPSKDRLAVASAFVAKAVYGFSTNCGGSAAGKRLGRCRMNRRSREHSTSSLAWNYHSSCTKP